MKVKKIVARAHDHQKVIQTYHLNQKKIFSLAIYSFCTRDYVQASVQNIHFSSKPGYNNGDDTAGDTNHTANVLPHTSRSHTIHSPHTRAHTQPARTHPPPWVWEHGISR